MKEKDKIIAILLGVLIIVLFVGGQYKSNREAFTKERWENYQGNSRQTILDSFIDRTNVGGLTKEEITEMLGVADEETEENLIYFLGRPRGLFGTKADSEDEFLLFTFEDGKVSQLEKVVAAELPKGNTYKPEAEPPSDGKFYPSGSKGGGEEQ